ncbi:MAG: methyltransferase domain-containing protein [Arenicella sp.]
MALSKEFWLQCVSATYQWQAMQSLSYTALEKIDVKKPVDRIGYICENAINKYVLDLGALDETAYEHKLNTEYWLHQRIAQQARFVRGVDSSELVTDQGLTPCDNSVIQRGDVYQLQPVIDEHGVPDLIVAGELIEHLPNSLQFLQSLKDIKALQGTRFIFTTPNACSLHNGIIGLFKRESTHIDHLTILSFKTLNTLCQRAGFQSWQCRPYYMKFPEMISKTQGFAHWSTRGFEKAINLGERLFPLLSGGWVVDVII